MLCTIFLAPEFVSSKGMSVAKSDPVLHFVDVVGATQPHSLPEKRLDDSACVKSISHVANPTPVEVLTAIKAAIDVRGPAGLVVVDNLSVLKVCCLEP